MNKSINSSDSFMENRTATLILGISGRIGSGASFITKAMMEEAKAFGYQPVEIKVTKWFLEKDYCCLTDLESNVCLVIKDIIKTISNDNQLENKNRSDKAQREHPTYATEYNYSVSETAFLP